VQNVTGSADWRHQSWAGGRTFVDRRQFFIYGTRAEATFIDYTKAITSSPVSRPSLFR